MAMLDLNSEAQIKVKLKVKRVKYSLVSCIYMGTTNFHCLHLAFPSVEASIHVTIFVAKPITNFYFYFSRKTKNN
jgi:hypothetical protein